MQSKKVTLKAKTSKKPGSAKAGVSRPHVLLTNDDGHFATGILALRREIARFAEVTIVAPETEQSAMSHSLTLHRPLRIRHVSPGIISVDGTPADCVYTALCSQKKLFRSSPHVVLSGINHGPNLGQDVFYSGTVAGAREAALRGKAAIAISAEVGSDFTKIARVIATFTKRVLADRSFKGQLLSFNFPLGWKGEVKTAVLGTRLYEDLVDLRHDPRGRPYAWIGGAPRPDRGIAGTDGYLFERGIATVTPLILDLTLREKEGRERVATALDAALGFVRTSR